MSYLKTAARLIYIRDIVVGEHIKILHYYK